MQLNDVKKCSRGSDTGECDVRWTTHIFLVKCIAHRVYKTSDPRSFIIRKTADEVFKVYVVPCNLCDQQGDEVPFVGQERTNF